GSWPSSYGSARAGYSLHLEPKLGERFRPQGQSAVQSLWMSRLKCTRHTNLPCENQIYTGKTRSKQGKHMIDRESAWCLLAEFTQSESLRKHALAVEACMRACARKYGSYQGMPSGMQVPSMAVSAAEGSNPVEEDL